MVRQVALPRPEFAQLGPPDERQPVPEAKSPPILGGRFAVGAHRCRFRRRRRREAQHGLDVAGRFRMMGGPGQVGDAPRPSTERRQRPAMQAQLAPRADRLLDREAGELVAERHTPRLGCQHASGQALVEPVEFLDHRLQQPQLPTAGGLRVPELAVEEFGVEPRHPPAGVDLEKTGEAA